VRPCTQERAARQLITPGALVQLSLAGAREVVTYMMPRRIPAGTTIFQAGDATDGDDMLLVIDGEVTVENQASPTSEGLVVTVLGPGSLIGEMSLIDGSPRSATCVTAGQLTKDALARLMSEQPGLATRLLLAISKRLSDNLRDANRKILTLSQVSRALQQELDAAHAINRRLLEPKGPRRN
jgi:CRP/FNR family cyclic AMP-dependent transcriptional regulator